MEEIVRFIVTNLSGASWLALEPLIGRCTLIINSLVGLDLLGNFFVENSPQVGDKFIRSMVINPRTINW
ncbi:MAG: hypothetical protein ACSI46_20260 [Gloeotrichia echinulata DVL01]